MIDESFVPFKRGGQREERRRSWLRVLLNGYTAKDMSVLDL